MDHEAELSRRTPMQELSSRDRAIQRVASGVVFVVVAILCIAFLAVQGKL